MNDKHIEGIDYIRIFAALNVALYHFTIVYGWIWHWNVEPFLNIPFSFGVPTFLIVTGFLLPSSIKKYPSLLLVYNRYARLLPALIVCSSLTILFAKLYPIHRYESIPILKWLLSWTMIPQVFGSKFLDAPYWTLQVQVYFLVFLIFIKELKLQSYLTWIFMFLVILSAPIKHYDLLSIPYEFATPYKQLSNIAISVFQFNYIHFFAVGYAFSRILQKKASYGEYILILCCVLVEYYIERLGIMRGIILYSFVAFFLFYRLPFKHPKIIKKMADMSYTFYLLHGAIGWISISYLHKVIGLQADLCVFLAMVLIAALSHFVSVYVEFPFYKKLRRKA